MILLTSCLQKLQQLKDKVNIFDQFNVIEEHNQSDVEIKANKSEDEADTTMNQMCMKRNENALNKCVFHL